MKSMFWSERPANQRIESHFVLAQIVGIEALEPLLQLVGVGLLAREIHRLGVVDDRLLDEDRGLGPQRERDRVRRPRVNRQGVAVAGDVDQCVEGVLLQIADR